MANGVIGSSRTMIEVGLVAAIEGTVEIGEGGSVEKARYEIVLNVKTAIDRIASIVLTKSIALRKAIALSDRIDSTDWTDLTIPAVGEIADSCVLPALHEPLKEWIFLSLLDTPSRRRLCAVTDIRVPSLSIHDGS